MILNPSVLLFQKHIIIHWNTSSGRMIWHRPSIRGLHLCYLSLIILTRLRDGPKVPHKMG
jgi:hypothetical protein